MLRQRVLTGVVLGVGLVALLLWLPPALIRIFFSVAILVAAWEWALFARLASPLSRTLYVVVFLAIFAATWRYTLTDQSALHGLLWGALAWWLVAFLWVVLAPRAHNRATAAGSGVLVMVPAGVALAHLYRQPEIGPQMVLFLLLLVWAADVGAFVAGRHFGRLKLAPHVSPHKTWEGLIGGVLVSAAVAAAGVWWFTRPPLAFISLCLGVVLMSIVGDLTESMFKRYAGLKDSGSIFPGHGGVLDRFDSVSAAAPLFLLGLHWLGWVS